MSQFLIGLSHYWYTHSTNIQYCQRLRALFLDRSVPYFISPCHQTSALQVPLNVKTLRSSKNRLEHLKGRKLTKLRSSLSERDQIKIIRIHQNHQKTNETSSGRCMVLESAIPLSQETADRSRVILTVAKSIPVLSGSWIRVGYDTTLMGALQKSLVNCHVVQLQPIMFSIMFSLHQIVQYQ